MQKGGANIRTIVCQKSICIGFFKQIAVLLVLMMALISCAEKAAKAGDGKEKKVQDQNQSAPYTPGDEAKIQKYSDFCAKLDSSSMDSILAAKGYFMREFGNDQRNAVQAIRVFARFHDSVKETCGPAYTNYGNNNYETNSSKGNSEQLKSYLEKNREAFKNIKYYGFTCISSEIEGFLETDYSFYFDMLKNIKSDVTDYYALKAQLTPECDTEVLLIQWDEVRNRIIACENFAKTHTNMKKESQETMDYARQLFDIYLVGAGHTKIYGDESKELEPNLRASYELFLKTNTDSSFYPLLKKVYEIHAEHNFKPSKDFMTYYKTISFTHDVPYHLENYTK